MGNKTKKNKPKSKRQKSKNAYSKWIEQCARKKCVPVVNDHCYASQHFSEDEEERILSDYSWDRSSCSDSYSGYNESEGNSSNTFESENTSFVVDNYDDQEISEYDVDDLIEYCPDEDDYDDDEAAFWEDDPLNDFHMLDNEVYETFGQIHYGMPDMYEYEITEYLFPEVGETQTDEECLLIGRRIVDIQFLFTQLKSLNLHSENGSCNFSDMKCVKERKFGLKSRFYFVCSKCHVKMCIYSAEPKQDSLDVNYASVLGAYAVGTGYAQCREYFANLEMTYMSSRTYNNQQQYVQNDLHVCAEKVKEDAMEEEKRLAVEKNEVDVNGTPLLKVCADGSWPKRCYGTSYSSKSGLVK